LFAGIAECADEELDEGGWLDIEDADEALQAWIEGEDILIGAAGEVEPSTIAEALQSL